MSDKNGRPRLRQSSVSFSDVDPASLYLSIYCAEPSHEREPYRIATYYVPDDEYSSSWPDGTPHWAEAVGQYWTQAGKVLVFDTARSYTTLVGDVPESDRHRLAEAGASRTNYNPECRRCGLKVTRAAVKFEPVVLKIALANVREVSLRALAAILTSA